MKNLRNKKISSWKKTRKFNGQALICYLVANFMWYKKNNDRTDYIHKTDWMRGSDSTMRNLRAITHENIFADVDKRWKSTLPDERTRENISKSIKIGAKLTTFHFVYLSLARGFSLVFFFLAWPVMKNDRLSSKLNFTRFALSWLSCLTSSLLLLSLSLSSPRTFLIYMYSCSSTYGCRLLHSNFNFSAIEWMRFRQKEKRKLSGYNSAGNAKQ